MILNAPVGLDNRQFRWASAAPVGKVGRYGADGSCRTRVLCLSGSAEPHVQPDAMASRIQAATCGDCFLQSRLQAQSRSWRTTCFITSP